MDTVLEAFQQIEWSYAEDDPSALAQLERRISRSGRRGDLLTYSQLVDGIEFDLPRLADRPHKIDVHSWTQLDRTIVGNFLGYISMRSYERAGFFASSLVVNKSDHLPGDGFFGLLHAIGLISAKDDVRGPIIWDEHLQKARDWYRHNR